VRDALRGLVTATAAIGRNGVPSVSEMVRRLGLAYAYAPEQTVELVLAVYALAGATQQPANTTRAPDGAQ